MDPVKEFELTADILNIDRSLLYEEMGYRDHAVPEQVKEITECLFNELENNINIKVGYKLFNNKSVHVQKNNLLIDLTEFDVKAIIASQLKGISSAALYLCTVGKGFDEWEKEFYNSGDQLEGYILDIIGSHLAEAAADWLEEKLNAEVTTRNIGCTNRYSPGYCGWDVIEQHKLFSFFEDGFLGVTLNDSGLMTPIKSTSGVIGIGEGISRKDYQCDKCRIAQCIKRNINSRGWS